MSDDEIEIEPFQQFLLDYALRVVAPLYWHKQDTAWPRVVHGATCFCLNFQDRRIGVTAAHVYRALDEARRSAGIITQIRTALAPVHLIDIDDEHDIATFEWHLPDAIALDCTGALWPPPKPLRGQGVVAVGFPEENRTVRADQSAEFGAWGALAAIEDFSRRSVLLTYDPMRDKGVKGVAPHAPLHFNMSGCSGGVVLMVGQRNGITVARPIALITTGPVSGEGLFADLDVIHCARLDVIRPDGTIRRD